MEDLEPATEEREPSANSPRRKWAKRIGWLLAAVLAPLVALLIVVNSPIGKRFIADEIARYAPASGLKVSIGRIDGDLYQDAVLHDVVLSDPKGVFLTIPVVELDWRPLAWFTRGLDVRKLVARRGKLERLPELLPGDPDAPFLPDFDIRIDRFEIDNLVLAPGLATPDAERVDLVARADIRDGLVKLRVDGELGKSDKLLLDLHAEPDGDRFDLDLDYRAPLGGVIAGLVKAEDSYHARIIGDGTWRDWIGHALVKRGDERFAAFRLTNRAGTYGLIGEIYAAGISSGVLQRALGDRTGATISGTLEDSLFDGSIRLGSRALSVIGEGSIDLADNRFDGFDVKAVMLDPQLFGEGFELRSASLQGTLEGGFREFSLVHELTVAELALGDAVAVGLRQEGTGKLRDGAFRLPLALAIGRIETASEMANRELERGRIGGELVYRDGEVKVDPLQVAFPRLTGRLALDANPAAGTLRITGPARLAATGIENVGAVAANARIAFVMADSQPWTLRADIDGEVTAVANATLASIAGEPVKFSTSLTTAGGADLQLADLAIESGLLALAGEGNWGEAGFAVTGTGRHANYGQFSIEATLQDEGPRAVLVLADPLPAAGLRDVRLALAPAGDGFDIETQGGSMFGDFDGTLGLTIPESGPALLEIETLRIWRTQVRGRLALQDAGARGRITIDGGGLTGTIELVPGQNGQQFDADFRADRASFGGETPIELGRANISFNGSFGEGNSSVRGTLNGRGLRYGELFLGRVAARVNLDNGSGKVTGSLVGRQGGRLTLQVDSDIAPGRIAALARGSFAGTPIAMPRRAVFSRNSDGGWKLTPAQLNVGEGRAAVSGEFGGGRTSLQIKLSRLPLSLGDLVISDLGLGGTMSGIVDYDGAEGQAPTADVRVKFEGLTRSGLLLASSPVDLSLVGSLKADRMEVQSVLASDDGRLGWMQARVAGMPKEGALYERLQGGALVGDMRYDGPSEALWRLAALDSFDLSGPVAIRAQARGSLAEPSVRGMVTSSNLRVRSVLSGTDIRDARVAGEFIGSRLFLRSFAGNVADGGTITGSGTIDLSDVTPQRGPRLDLRAAANRARLVDAQGLRATVTGPLRIVSSGNGGTIAGRLVVDRASWQLGTAAEVAALPEIKTREINLPTDIEPVTTPSAPWRYLIDAKAANRIAVDGMGLDSEWGADIILRGTTADPRIGGSAQVVRGTYSFAGTNFELTRGRIVFDENVPIDPRLDIVAETTRDGLNVTVNVRGRALTPEITFSSDPALPEEEILARLLFGGSISTLSPTDALQLGAALASLRGGSGLDPINKLRNAIGLDRLRIVGADPALGRETGVALGENLGRNFYVELITDGRGYSATQLEFRITSWLSLLGSVSTLGRNSVVVEVSRDY